MSAATPPISVRATPEPGAGRVVAIVLGALLGLIAAGLLLGGAGLVAAHLFERDDHSTLR